MTSLVNFGQLWLTLVNLGQPLVKTQVKNPLNTLCPPISPGTFAAFSKFHLNTSTSPNVKFVYFIEGHNFHVEWHCWFEVQNGENAGQRLQALFTRAEISVKFHCLLCKIC
jgi:hypothetical protein